MSMRFSMHTIKRRLEILAWIESGTNPAADEAPPIDDLYAMAEDDLIVMYERFGGIPLIALTSHGIYERDRLRAVADRSAASAQAPCTSCLTAPCQCYPF